MKRAFESAMLMFVLALCSACTERTTAQTKAPAPPPVPVGVAAAEQKSVPVQVTAVGTVQAFTTVGVKSQVAGQIQKVHFTEGQDVKQGQLLFSIDPRPLEAGPRARRRRGRARSRRAGRARAPPRRGRGGHAPRQPRGVSRGSRIRPRCRSGSRRRRAVA